MTAQYANPVRIVCGAGALASLPEVVGARRVFLVTSPSARALGLIDRLERLLGDRLAGLHERVRPNPDVAELGTLYETFWRCHRDAQVLLAVGGGSVIDTAKVLMVGTAGGRFDVLAGALAAGREVEPAQLRPLIAVPTTAGTGSEVTPWATVWDRAAGRKHSLHLAHTWPSCAIVDAELALSLPPATTLHSGLDALSHALESIWNVNANPVSDTFAVAAVHEILEVLPALLRRPDELALRERMATGALKAGLAFSNTRTALAHSISYELSLRHGLPHGLACSFTLPMVLQSAIGRRADRDAVLAQALGPLDAAPRRLRDFLEGLGVATDFAAHGVDAAEAQRLVAQALTGPRGRNFIGAGGGSPGA